MDNPINRYMKLGWAVGREALPTYARLFGDVFADDRSTVTNKDFTQEELDIIRQLVQQSNAYDVEKVTKLEAERDSLVDAIWQKSNDDWAKATTKEAKLKVIKDRHDALDAVDKRIQSYYDTVYRTYVDYKNYWDTNKASLNEANKNPFQTSPQQSVLNSIGQFKAVMDEQGNATINDEYKMDLNWEAANSYNRSGIRDYLEALAYEYNPDYKRQINVTIPDVDWELPRDYWKPKEEVVDLEATGFESTIK